MKSPTRNTNMDMIDQLDRRLATCAELHEAAEALNRPALALLLDRIAQTLRDRIYAIQLNAPRTPDTWLEDIIEALPHLDDLTPEGEGDDEEEEDDEEDDE